MSAVERRQALLEVLCRRRFDTYANLAFEFGVSTRTIQRDIQILMCSYPIETMRGRYGGGMKYVGKCSHNGHIIQRLLNTEQVALLEELKTQVSGKKLDILNSIIYDFAP